ncbi:MAG: hypothetical protein JNL70_18040 [Saprospiraceae bacterium]|nr:hypothetical protein [Saprospiraceae bacterium]
MELNFEGIDRSHVAVYKKGEEPSDVKAIGIRYRNLNRFLLFFKKK